MAVRPLIYIAGPLTTGNQIINTNLANQAAARLMRAGLAPFVPHNMILCELVSPGPSYEEWLDLCLTYLSRCDALLRLPGESPGADREVAFARGLGIPVFTREEDLTAIRRG